jgi:hypothetical protein
MAFHLTAGVLVHGAEPFMLSEVISCIFCEGIREEVGGKATIVGFGGVLPYVTVGIAGQLPQVVDITLLLLAKGEGDASVDFEIIDPNGLVLVEQRALHIDWDNSEQIVSIATRFQGFPIKSEGKYTVRFLADSQEVFKSSFVIKFHLGR